MNHKNFITEVRTADIAMSEAMTCMDLAMCNAACSSCPNHGTSWACPPFDRYDFPGLHPEQFEHLLIMVISFTAHQPIPTDEAYRLFRDEALKHVSSLRQKARSLRGVTYGLACSCDLCNEPCTRLKGEECRHPDKSGPSLEAAGFDVGLLLKKFFSLELAWGNEGHAPAVTRYVAAVAY